jgi:hypothetical protein
MADLAKFAKTLALVASEVNVRKRENSATMRFTLHIVPQKTFENMRISRRLRRQRHILSHFASDASIENPTSRIIGACKTYYYPVSHRYA